MYDNMGELVQRLISKEFGEAATQLLQAMRIGMIPWTSPRAKYTRASCTSQSPIIFLYSAPTKTLSEACRVCRERQGLFIEPLSQHAHMVQPKKSLMILDVQG